MIVVVTADSQGDFMQYNFVLYSPTQNSSQCTHVVLGGGGCVDVVVVVIVVVVAAGRAVNPLVLPVAASTSADFKISEWLFDNEIIRVGKYLGKI